MIEKAAYIKGLCDGLELDNSTKEGKVILALLGLVEEMAETIDEMQAKMSDLENYCEELDEDLGDVEEVLLGLLYGEAEHHLGSELDEVDLEHLAHEGERA